MQMILQPVVSLKTNRFSSSKYIKIKLPGSCSVQLAGEVYSFTLPKLLIKNLSEASADIELAGKAPGQWQYFRRKLAPHQQDPCNTCAPTKHDGLVLKNVQTSC